MFISPYRCLNLVRWFFNRKVRDDSNIVVFEKPFVTHQKQARNYMEAIFLLLKWFFVKGPLCSGYLVWSVFDISTAIKCNNFYFFLTPVTEVASANSGQGDCSVNMATISPLASPANLLQQTEDQIPSNFEGPFVNLLPPLLQEDYLLSLGDEEGISDLFDAYDLEKLPSLMDEFIYSWLS